MKRPFSPATLIGFLFCLMLCGGAQAQSEQPAEVMLIGVFHFANPGLDTVKTEVSNVMTEDNQAYLEALTDRIAAFKPTAVLLEYDRKNDALVNERYSDYQAGNYELGINEIYQLGFRIANKAGLDAVRSFDEREVQWNARPMMEKIETLPARKAQKDEMIANIVRDMTELHETSDLATILRWHNDPAADQANKSLYLMTNDIGAGDGFEGADAAASWWHRNFRMYALIQQHAQPGERVVVIGGQGHTAILRDLLKDDPDRMAVEVQELF